MNGQQTRLTIWTVGPAAATLIAVLAWWGGHEAALRAEGREDGSLDQRMKAVEFHVAKSESLTTLLYDTSANEKANEANITALAVSIRDLVSAQRETNLKLDRLIETLRFSKSGQ